MSVVAVGGYGFASSHELSWGGFCLSLDEAKQECQAVAAGALHWAEVDESIWAARDTVNVALYQIEQLPL